MATSGSIDYTVNRTKIISTALQMLNVIAAGETPSAEDYALTNDILNMMVKSWQADGLHLWATQEATLFTEKAVSEYSISSAATSAGASVASDIVITDVATAIAVTDTTIVVDSTAGMTANDVLGIQLDDGSIFWTTITSVDSATGLTLASAVSGEGAAVDNNVYTFTSRLNRPLRISSCRYVTGTGTNLRELNLNKLSRDEYYSLPNKNSNGTPNSFYYDPQLGAGKLHLWPRPDNSSSYVRFTHERALEDFDNTTDEPDFPQEWMETLLYNLAARIGPAFGRAGDPNYSVIVSLAEGLKRASLTWDREITHVQFTLDD